MRVFSILILGLSALATLSGCEPKLDATPTPAAGSLDASRYVALGDDFAAGLASGGLTRERQEYSFPNLLARQLRLAGGGEFVQPLLADGESTGGVMLVGLTDGNQALIGPAPVGSLDSEAPASACEPMRYRFPAWAGADAGTLPHNLGIPGLRLQDLAVAGLGDNDRLHTPAVPYNGFLERLLPDGADTASYLTLIERAQPTFVTVSFGLSDLLPFVQSGGTGGVCGSLPSGVSTHTRVLLDALLAHTSAKVLLLGAPKLSSLPLASTDVADINRSLGRSDTASMFVLTAAGVPTRTISTDIVLLPLVGRIGRAETATGAPASAPFGLSLANPLRKQDVLNEADFKAVETLTYRGPNSINGLLKARATANPDRVVFLDINSLLSLMLAGRYIDGVRYSGDPVTGGLFSLDGYSLTPRGNGLLVNYIIETLNTTTSGQGFGARLPLLDINTLPPTQLP